MLNRYMYTLYVIYYVCTHVITMFLDVYNFIFLLDTFCFPIVLALLLGCLRRGSCLLAADSFAECLRFVETFLLAVLPWCTKKLFSVGVSLASLSIISCNDVLAFCNADGHI